MNDLFPFFPHSNKEISFTCCTNYSAISVHGLIMIFQNDERNKKIKFKYSIKINNQNYQKLKFNENYYSTRLILASYSSNTIIFIDVLKRKVIKVLSIITTDIFWDVLFQNSFFHVGDGSILQHFSLDFDSDNDVKDKNWSIDVLSLPKKLIFHPFYSENMLLLTENGYVYHFKIKSGSKLPILIKKFNNETNKIIDINASSFDFFIIITDHSIGVYHLNDNRLVWVICVSNYFPDFVGGISHPNYLNYFFVFSNNHRFYAWKFSKKQNVFKVKNSEFILFHLDFNFHGEFYTLWDRFIFLANNSSLETFVFFKNKFIFKDIYYLPIISNKYGIPSKYRNNFLFLTQTNILSAMCQNEIKIRISHSDIILDALWFDDNSIVFNTSNSIYIYNINFNTQKLILSSGFVHNNGKEMFSNLKSICGLIFIQLGDSCVISINPKTKEKELYTLDDIVSYELISNVQDSFIIIFKTKDQKIKLMTPNGKIPYQTYDIPYETISGFININGDIGIYLTNGQIVFAVHKMKLQPASKILYNNGILIVSTAKEILVYKYFNKDFIPVCVFDIKNSEIISFDGNVILLVTKEKILSTISLNYNQSKQENNEENIIFPSTKYLDFDYIKSNYLNMIYLFSSLKQIPKEVIDIRFLMNENILLSSNYADFNEIYRNVFLSFYGIQLTKQQKELIFNSLKYADESDLPIFYHFINEHNKVVECLIQKKQYEFGIFYSHKYGLIDMENKCISCIIDQKIKRKEFIYAAAIACHIKDYNLAISILSANGFKSHMNKIIEEHKNEIDFVNKI